MILRLTILCKVVVISILFEMANFLKPNNISILHFVPIGREDSYDVGTSCIAATEIALGVFNRRNDILPDYNVQMDYRDEAGGYGAVRPLLDFSSNADGFTSPLAIGPQYSPGCAAIGRILRNVNMATMSTYCQAPALSDRSKYSNLYLNLFSGQAAILASLRFIVEVGRWTKFGLLSYTQGIRNIQVAVFGINAVRGTNLTIPWSDFTMVMDGKDVLSQFKQTDLRVLVIEITFTGVLQKILCETYNQGIRGPRYTFFAPAAAFVAPDLRDLKAELLPGCTVGHFMEQMKRTFWSGGIISPLEQTKEKKSIIGHTWPEFEALTNAALNNTIPGDYIARYMCYDATIAVVTALDLAEKKLIMLNSSLKEYKSNPDLVFRIANESIMENKADGLRTPAKIGFNKAGLPENDILGLDMVDENGNLVTVATVHQRPGSSETDKVQSYYVVIQRESFLYSVWSNHRDGPIQVKDTNRVGFSLSTGLTISAGLASMGQIFMAGLVKNKGKSSHFQFSKYFGLFGCILVNIGVCMAIVNDISVNSASSMIFFVTVGLAMTNAFVALRPWQIVTGRKKSKRRSNKKKIPGAPSNVKSSQTTSKTSNAANIRPAVTQKPVEPQIDDPILLRQDKMTLAFSLIFVAINVIYVVIWLLTNPIACQPTVEYSYDYSSDVARETTHIVCSSENMMNWILGNLFFQAALLVGGLFYSLKMTHYVDKNMFIQLEGTYIRAGIINALMLTFATLIIAIAIGKAIGQLITVAAICLAYSLMQSASWVIPMFRKKTLVPTKSQTRGL